MTNKHGRNFEHTLANGVDDITPREVWTTTVGYSGNADTDDCDVVITVDPKYATRHDTRQFNVEAKKRNVDSGKRASKVFGGGKTFETGVEELQRFIEGTPSWADPIVAIKFDRRKLIVLDGRWLLDALDLGGMAPPSSESILDVLSPRTTRSDNVSMVKPTLEQWPSASASMDDATVLCERLGLPYEDGEETPSTPSDTDADTMEEGV